MRSGPSYIAGHTFTALVGGMVVISNDTAPEHGLWWQEGRSIVRILDFLAVGRRVLLSTFPGRHPSIPEVAA